VLYFTQINREFFSGFSGEKGGKRVRTLLQTSYDARVFFVFFLENHVYLDTGMGRSIEALRVIGSKKYKPHQDAHKDRLPQRLAIKT
jgi:hypothetical protein